MELLIQIPDSDVTPQALREWLVDLTLDDPPPAESIDAETAASLVAMVFRDDLEGVSADVTFQQNGERLLPAGRCAKCNNVIGGQFSCFGCEAYVCHDCGTDESVSGPHVVDDHFEKSSCHGDRITIDGECASCGERPEA